MTPAEALEAAVRAQDEAAIRALIGPLTEAERATLVPVARAIVAEVRRKQVFGRELIPCVHVAYAVLPATEIRKLGWRAAHLPTELEVVLRRLSPERLVPIVEYLLDVIGGRAWRFVRPLVREGIVPRPDRPSYTIAMLAGTRWSGADELIAEDPGHLEVEAWRLFEVEGGGEDSLANHEKFHDDSWGTVFRELAARDAAMRERILDVSLAALARDFSSYRAGWFSRFHESLGPTEAERVQRSDAYLGLLRSRVGPTVSFAVTALSVIQRAGGLPSDGLFDRIGPVLEGAPAGTARTGLDMVERAGAGTPQEARRAAITAAAALAHASPDVQRAAIGVIGRLIADPDEAVARAVADRLPEVAASQRSIATGLLTRLGGHVSGARSSPESSALGPAAPRSTSAIDPARAIEPLSSIVELVDVAVSVLETGEPADDVERVLDAVGRLATDRTAESTRLTAPLAKRARTILARRESLPFTGFDARADVAALMLAWVAGELLTPAETHSSVDPGAGAFLSARAREIAEAAASGRTFLGVAAPTHVGGWIDPAALVGRLGMRGPASKLDLVGAVLRLAADGRDVALRSASSLGGEVGAVVRYALGGDEAIGKTAAWWVAAARARSPGADDPSVEKRHPRLGPDAGRAAQVRLVVTASRGWVSAGVALEIEPKPGDQTGVDLPTLRMLRNPSIFSWTGRSDPAMVRWMATIQPGYREPWAAVGAMLIGRNVDWWSAEWANRAFLEPFLDPVTEIGPHARTMVAIALGAKEAGERGLATDIVGLALADGRLAAATLAEGLAAASAVDCDRPNRWALSLADVAASSGAHSIAVAEAIARTLPALTERPPAKLVPLLRLLDELSAAAGSGPAEAGRASLERLAGSGGQAGRLARSILSRG